MKGMDFQVPLPPVVMRAALPVVRGQSLLWTGELMIGRTRIHIVGSTPLADAEQAWQKITGYAAKQRKIPLRLGDLLDEETGSLLTEDEETEGVFDDVVNFMTSSPIGKTIEAAASFVPGLNTASSAAFGAAKLYQAARGHARKKGKRPPKRRNERARAPLPTSTNLRPAVDFAREYQQAMAPKLQQMGKRVRLYSDEELMRAAQAVELLELARAGHPDALKAVGKMRTVPHRPASPHHLDLLALDAAQFINPIEDDDAIDVQRLDALAVEGLSGEPQQSQTTSGIITADQLRESMAGGKSCGCP